MRGRRCGPAGARQISGRKDRTLRPIFLFAGPPLVFALATTAAGVLRFGSHHDVAATLVVVALHFGLAAPLWGTSLAASTAPAWAHVAATLPSAGLLLFALREHTAALRSPGAFSAGCVALAVLLALSTRRRASLRPTILWTVATGTLFATGSALVARTPGETRWHVLSHHTILGPIAYYLWCEPIASVRQALFAARATGPPAPPAATAADSSQPGREPGPHLVLVLIDALRADALRAWGGRALTPHLDAAAERGFTFLDVLANSSWTRSSVASLFTGELPEEHGARGRSDAIRSGTVTLAEELRARGYDTAAFVSNFGAVSRSGGFDRGFSRFVHVEGRPYGRAGEVNRAVAEHLAARSRERQFLYVHYLDPHAPYTSGAAGGPEGLLPASYAAELRYVDAAFGELMEILETSLDEELVVLVVSDHGEAFGEHGYAGHGKDLYRESLHVPAALLGLGRGHSDARLELRHFRDLLARLGAGEGVVPAAWSRETSPTDRYASLYLFTEMRWYRPNLMWVATRLVESPQGTLIWSALGPSHELYRAADVAQSTNLADEEPERVRLMEERMERAVGFWTASEPSALDEAELEKLRALGYVR